MENSSETVGRQTGDLVGIDVVFRDSGDEIMNVAVLLNHLRHLRRTGRAINIVEFALAEAEALHVSGNDHIDYENFVREVGRRVLSTLE